MFPFPKLLTNTGEVAENLQLTKKVRFHLRLDWSMNDKTRELFIQVDSGKNILLRGDIDD